MTLIQLRRGSAAAWSTTNPILAAGEVGVETDTSQFKIGDGSSTWTALLYANGGGTGGSSGPAAWADVTGKPDALTIGSNVANGYAGLDGNGKVPTAQLPSYVDDVLEFVNLAAFPGTGEGQKIYVAQDTNRTYRWTGSTYVIVGDGTGGGGGAVSSVAGRTGAVTLTADDTPDGTTNKAYTAAEKSKLGAISGLNTGDQTIPTSLPPTAGSVDVSKINAATLVTAAETIAANNNDTTLPTSAAVSGAITTAVNALLNGAPGALDTLKELADAINDDASFAATVTTALGGKVSRTSTPLQMYGTDGSGAQITGTYSDAATANTLALRGTGGTLAVGDATSSGHAATKSQMDTADALKAPHLIPTAVKTSAYTAAANDLIPVDATSAAVTITLPTTPADKTRIAVKSIGTTVTAGGFTVTVATAGSDVFNKTGGSTSLSLVMQNQGVSLQYKASGGIWYVVSTDVPASGLDDRYGTAFTGWDVILVAGQSNAADYGIGVDATYLDNPDPRIKQYSLAINGTYTNQIVTAVNPLLSRIQQDSSRIGFAMTFAKDYLDGLGAGGAHRKVLIVPAAMGNTGFTSSSLPSPPAGYYQGADGTNSGSWDPTKGDGGFSLYQNAIDKANAAIATKTGSKIVAVLWLQGEGDSTLGQTAYAAKLDALIDGFRANITGAATVPFVVGQMVPDWSSFNTQINAAHVATPTRKTRCAFAPGASGVSNPTEAYHYNAAGQRLMGHSMYTAFATI